MANQVKSIDGLLIAYIKNILGLTDLHIKTINGIKFTQIPPDVITGGTAFTFESSRIAYVSAVMLTSTKVLVSYSDNSNSSYGTSIILNISNDTITAGTPFTFASTRADYTIVIALSSTKMLDAYSDFANILGKSIVLNVSI